MDSYPRDVTSAARTSRTYQRTRRSLDQPFDVNTHAYTTRDPVYTHTASWLYEYELSCRYDTPRTCTVDDIDKHRFEDDDSGQCQSVTIFHSCTKTLYAQNICFFLVPTAGLQPLFASIICIYELRFHGSYTCNELGVRLQDVFWRNVFEEVGVL